MDGFLLPFTLLQVKYANMVHAWYRETASITEHITVLAIPYTSTMRANGWGTVVHILAHFTGRLVWIFPVTPHSPFFIIFPNSQSDYDWNARRWYTMEAIYLYIVITCACLIGNNVLVIRNTNVTQMARLRHCNISLLWVPSRHEQAWDGFWFYGIERFYEVTVLIPLKCSRHIIPDVWTHLIRRS